MTITIQLPPGIDESAMQRAEQDAREAIAARLYREEKLSHGQLAKFLGIGRGEVDELLARFNITDYRVEDVRREFKQLREELGLSDSGS